MDIFDTNKTETGFTIIEVLIAILIFSIGILSAASMQTASIFGNSKSMKFTEASQLATNQAEEIKMVSYATLIEGSSEIESEGSTGEDYKIKSDVEDIYTSTNGVSTLFAKKITITVEWDNKSTDLSFIKAPAF